MRITIALFFIGIHCLFADNAYSQKAKVTINKRDVLLETVLNEIENQTDYLFIYSKSNVDVSRKVSLKSKNKPVKEILDNIFEGTDVVYTLEGTHVVLSRKEHVLSPEQSEKQITGLVTDESGEPLPGVSIQLKGSALGTITGEDGTYIIKVPDENGVLVYSYIGYIPVEQSVSSHTSINVVLKEGIQNLDEVVVIGYGTARRVNLSGAISTASAETFESRPIQNAVSALQGQIPGLTITRSSGAPGSSATMRIRDVSSLNGGEPLVLIDGAEGSLDKINPADIESVSVLKDGTAAIYGARAADGVILITTKSGQRNQPLKVILDAYYSIKTPALMKKTVNLYQYATMGLEVSDGSFTHEYTAEDLPLIAEGSDLIVPNGIWGAYPKWYKSQNWRDLVIGNGHIQKYNLNLSGGGEKYTYLISLGYQNEGGLPKFGVDKEDRYFIRAKSNIRIVKGLDYELNLSYEASDRKVSSAINQKNDNLWELMFKARCWQPMYNPAGEFYLFQGFTNPAQAAEEHGITTKTTGDITINNTLKWEVIKGLNIVGRAIISKRDGDENEENKIVYERNWDNQIQRGQYAPNWNQRRYNKTLYKNFTLYAEYKNKFAELHDLGVMIGVANESSNYDKFSAQRINFTQQEIMALPFGSSENQLALSEGNAWTINSVFSRLNYSFAGKYILEGVLRADASSRFAKDYRWGYFPGVSAAWRVGEEKFMKDATFINDLKLRGSYGEMGNQSGIGLYDYIQLVTIHASDNYPFGNGVKGQLAKPGNIVSTKRTWETVASTDIGLDFSALNNRLFGSFDYFWKTNKDMLIPVTYPSVLGASAPATNNGRLEVKGWGITLGWRDQIGDFSYSVRANLSDSRNKIVEKGGTDNPVLGLNHKDNGGYLKGYALNSYLGYEFDGIIQNETQLEEYKARFPKGGIPGNLTIGDAMYKDLDGDGVLSVSGDGTPGAGDAVYLGDRNPRYSYGFNFNGSYKGFDLRFFLQGVGKRTTFLEGTARVPFEQYYWDPIEYWYGKTWTPERTNAKYPAITLQEKRYYNYQYSTNTRRNAAYMRLKNLQFGYTIPNEIIRKFEIEKVRLYFSGEDLFEVHNVPGGWDPESDEGITSYPFARSFSFGINVTY
jgi:TonB-linked SusC/RagA family outer membrane protein